MQVGLRSLPPIMPQHRPRLALPFALAIALGAPAMASAQTQATGSITVAPISIEGRDDASFLGELSVGIEECKQNAEIVFRLDNLPDATTLDVWVGDECTSTDRGNADASNNCEQVLSQSIDGNTGRFDVTVGVGDLAMAQGFDCDSGSKGSTKLWFLAVDSPGSKMAVGTSYGFFPSGSVTKFDTDLDPPDAPSDVSGGSGENQIPVEWDIAASDLERFIVYADSDVTGGGGSDGGNAECDSARLRAGAAAESAPDSLRVKTVNEGTATGTTLRGSDIDGDVAAVAVVAVDTAGNMSALSEVVCVHVIPTDGFWDVYEAEGGDAAQGCPCTAMGPAQLEGALPIGLAIGWLGLVSRRRRRARR